jgi:hypothetical protein
MLAQSVLSLKYVAVPVFAKASGLAVNPTTDTVQMAFPAPDVDPVSGDWKTASWETDASATPTVYYARCLVGPGGTVALALGTFDIWIKITDSPEIPAERVGNLQIT